MILKNFIYKSWISSPCGPDHFRKSHFFWSKTNYFGSNMFSGPKTDFLSDNQRKPKSCASQKLCNKMCLTIPILSRYDSSPIFVFACSPIFDDLEEEDDDDDNNDDDDTETPDPVQARIPSHPGIKYLVRGIPPSDY